MLDSEDSTVTYTAVSSPFRRLSDIGSPGVDGPPVMPKDSYAYVFMPLVDELLPAEEQPLPAATSPTNDSPAKESDPKEDQEEDDDEDPKEDLADYHANKGDDGDDEDDDVDIERDEEEEENPAPTDSTAVALPAIDHAPSAKETNPFETDESAATPPPHPAYQIPSSPLPPILSSLPVSSPLLVSPPLPLAPPPLPVSPTYPLGYKATIIWLRAEAPSTSHSPPPHILLSHTRADTPPSADKFEVTLPPRKRLGIALGPRYEVGKSSSAPTARPPRGFKADYSFVATMGKEIMRDLKRDVGYEITDTWDEMLVDMQDTNEIYVRLDDEQTKRQLMAGRLNMLYRDRYAHARITLLMEREARMSREAWGRSMNTSDLPRSEVMSLRTTTQMIAFQRQQGPAKGPAQPDAPGEAGSSS
ncbi:hypothetical protein Tco_0862127 [Tanacetum coccineum]